MKRPYDSTVARIAGNILSGSIGPGALLLSSDQRERLVHDAVLMARAIVAEVKRTEPKCEYAESCGGRVCKSFRPERGLWCPTCQRTEEKAE